MTIQESNKLIAEFEGRLFYGHPISGFGGNTGNALPQMKYHTSWDWLMPVIEKISQHKWEPDEDYSTYVYPVTFGMRRESDGQYMFRFVCSGLFIEPKLIDAAYKAVVDWIQWHNETKAIHTK
jgi:hypothetical protein